MIREAHENGLICVTWIYPRGQAVADEKDPQLISGAAGVALCIGADFTKVNYPRGFEGMSSPESLAVAVEAAVAVNKATRNEVDEVREAVAAVLAALLLRAFIPIGGHVF